MNVLAFLGKNGGNLGENMEKDWGKTRGEYGEILGQIRERNTIDDILRQSGVHTSHLLQWTTPFELWVAERRTQGHVFDTYADLLHVCKGPFSRMFQLYFTDLPFGTVGTWDK